MLYVANVSEDEVADPSENKYLQQVQEYAANEGTSYIICAKIEEEISELDDEEKKEFLNELGIPESD